MTFSFSVSNQMDEPETRRFLFPFEKMKSKRQFSITVPNNITYPLHKECNVNVMTFLLVIAIVILYILRIDV